MAKFGKKTHCNNSEFVWKEEKSDLQKRKPKIGG